MGGGISYELYGIITDATTGEVKKTSFKEYATSQHRDGYLHQLADFVNNVNGNFFPDGVEATVIDGVLRIPKMKSNRKMIISTNRERTEYKWSQETDGGRPIELSTTRGLGARIVDIYTPLDFYDVKKWPL